MPTQSPPSPFNTTQAIDWLRYIDSRSTRLRLAALLEEIQAAHDEVKHTKSQVGLELATTFAEFAQYGVVYFLHFWEHGNVIDLHRAIAKIEHELLTLRPLIEQRRRIPRGRGGAKLAKIQQQLTVCDAIATDCIRRSVDSAGDKANRADKFCLTMFHDSTYVRIGRTAYNRTATIALPQSVWDEPWLWLGIAHEVGHYWFWNYNLVSGYSQNREGVASQRIAFKERIESAFLDDQKLGHKASDLLQNLDRVAKTQALPTARIAPIAHWLNWAEELFADIFGALLLGPTYVQSLIFWLHAGLNRERLLADDGHHPLTILRPLAQIEALRQSLEELGQAGDFRIMVGGEGSFLESQGRFDIPDLKQLWQDLCADVAQCPFDKLMSEQLGSFTLRDYVEVFMPAAVGIVVRLIHEVKQKNSQALRLYTRDDHEHIRKAAAALAAAEEPDAATSGALSPALALCAAWYAWREITQEWVKKENGWPLFPGHPLANKRIRAQRLRDLRNWLTRQCLASYVQINESSSPDETAAPQWPISSTAMAKLRNSQQITRASIGVQAELFDQLVKDLTVLYDKNQLVINQRLLQIEFSIQRWGWVTIIDPDTGKWIKVWHSTVGGPPV